jgi:hypothetical protein
MATKNYILNKLALAVLLFFCFAATCSAGLPGNITNYGPFSVDVSGLVDFYGKLPADEKAEQLRDWAFYGLFISLGSSDKEAQKLSGSGLLMRYPSRKDQHFTVLGGRVAFPDDKNCYILVPVAEAANPGFQGQLIDNEMLPNGSIPEKVHVFAYSPEISSGAVTVTYIKTVPGWSLFSKDHGYFKQEISDTAALAAFLNGANVLTSAGLGGVKMTVSGRETGLKDTGAVSLDDVAALYQAYFKPALSEKEKQRRESYEHFIAQKYEQLVKRDKTVRADIKAGRAHYAQIISRLKKKYPYTSLEDNAVGAGFSLDPIFDYKGIVAGITSLCEKSYRFSADTGTVSVKLDPDLSALIDTRAGALRSLASNIKTTQSITPLLKFRREFQDTHNIAEMKLDSALLSIEMDNTYQTARYDGNIKGTDAAMILFYTDLVAKLWALDFGGLAPRKDVAGFFTLADVRVPRIYWKDFVKLSKTRLWFGMKQESFDIDENNIVFAPVATRVYAASSDPLYPGKETKPNYQSKEFLGWWDRHYSLVADYEPYYYKLNELLKWSCVMMVLKEKHSHALDFLAKVPVQRSLDFESWYTNEPAIKAKTKLPFVDRAAFKSSNECFKMLSSRGYPLMGQTYFVSGGVSLASMKDIEAKLHRARKTANGAGTSKSYSSKHSHTAKNNNAVASRTREPAVKTPPPAGFGEMVSKLDGHTVKLVWQKKEGAVLDECVNSLVEIERDLNGRKSENMFSKLNGIEKLVRIEASKTYLIKSKLMSEQWIYLEINPGQDKSSVKGAYTAAGSDPDSDIFRAKAVPPAIAQQLISAKTAVTLIP